MLTIIDRIAADLIRAGHTDAVDLLTEVAHTGMYTNATIFAAMNLVRTDPTAAADLIRAEIPCAAW